jgi:hypothetical protein
MLVDVGPDCYAFIHNTPYSDKLIARRKVPIPSHHDRPLSCTTTLGSAFDLHATTIAHHYTQIAETTYLFCSMSMKRKAASGLLARRVRPRREDDWEPEADPSSGGSSASEDDDEEVSEEEIQHGSDSSEEDGSGDDVISVFPWFHLVSIAFTNKRALLV